MHRTIPSHLVYLIFSVIVGLAFVEFFLFRARQTVEKLSPPLKEKYLPRLLRLQNRQLYIELFFLLFAFCLVAITLWGPDWVFRPLAEFFR